MNLVFYIAEDGSETYRIILCRFNSPMEFLRSRGIITREKVIMVLACLLYNCKLFAQCVLMVLKY